MDIAQSVHPHYVVKKYLENTVLSCLKIPTVEVIIENSYWYICFLLYDKNINVLFEYIA